MKKTRNKIALLVGGTVALTLLLLLLIFNLGIRQQIQKRSFEAIRDSLSSQAPYQSLYFAELIITHPSYYTDPEERNFYSKKEKTLIRWSDAHPSTEIQKVTINGKTFYLKSAPDTDLEDYRLIAYVDITGEITMIFWINVVFFLAALIIGLFGSLVGRYVGIKLEQAQSSQKQFFENTSHELKTPLTAIMGYAEALETGVVKDPGKAARIISSQTQRMSSLIDDILTIARIESGSIILRKKHIDLDEFLQNCMAPFEAIAANNKLNVILDLQPGEISADPDQLEHAFTNLITNALRNALTSFEISYDGKILIFKNDCPPLDPHDLDHIFDRFYTGKGGKTGIGLSLTKEIIQLHGWTITAAATPEGISFTIPCPSK